MLICFLLSWSFDPDCYNFCNFLRKAALILIYRSPCRSWSHVKCLQRLHACVHAHKKIESFLLLKANVILTRSFSMSPCHRWDSGTLTLFQTMLSCIVQSYSRLDTKNPYSIPDSPRVNPSSRLKFLFTWYVSHKMIVYSTRLKLLWLVFPTQLKGTMSRRFHSFFWSDKIIFSLRETSK